jgi:hypothetical protein
MMAGPVNELAALRRKVLPWPWMRPPAPEIGPEMVRVLGPSRVTVPDWRVTGPAQLFWVELPERAERCAPPSARSDQKIGAVML